MKKINCPFCNTKFTEELIYNIEIYDDYKVKSYKCLNKKCGNIFKVHIKNYKYL